MYLDDETTRDVARAFWERFALTLISEEEVYEQLENTYPPEALVSLRAYLDQPIATGHKLRRWIDHSGLEGTRSG